MPFVWLFIYLYPGEKSTEIVVGLLQVHKYKIEGSHIVLTPYHQIWLAYWHIYYLYKYYFLRL